MRIERLHDWQLTTTEAKEQQLQLALRVSRNNELGVPHFIAGVDMSVKRDAGIAAGAVVVLKYPELEVVEVGIAEEELGFPYIPGLLSFRELPVILRACEKLSINPDLVLVDGQGIAHPRRFGLASHLGLFLDTPTIGCAKSLLCGSHVAPGDEAGNYEGITDSGEIIGVVLRTKRRIKPVYVSIGHKVDLATAIHWVLSCCRGYRLPEPTRLAHLAAGENLKQAKVLSAPAKNY
ncbi:MAG: deoxyribonuclease V [Dehalococcoidales bacterium]|nr:MAG: deoxyribonuclease V [Dehalococcoidales bacterium]